MSKKYRYRPEVAKQDGVKEIDENQDGQIDKLEIDGEQQEFTEEKVYVEGQERPKGYELVEEADKEDTSRGVEADANNASGQDSHASETIHDGSATGTQTVQEGTVPSDPKVSTEPQGQASEAQTGQEGTASSSPKEAKEEHSPTSPAPEVSQPPSPPPAAPEPPVATENGNPAPAAGTEHQPSQPPSQPEGQVEGVHESQPQQSGSEDSKHQEEKKPDQGTSETNQSGQSQGSEKPNQDQPPKPADQDHSTPSQGNPGGNPSSGSGVVQADLTPITDTAEQIPQEPAPKLSEAESFGQSIKQRIDAYARDMGPNVSQTEASLVRHQVDLYHIFQTVLTVSEYDKFEAGIKALYAGFQENYALCFNYDARFRGIMNIPVSKLKEDQVEVLTSLIDLFCRLASAKSLVDLRGTYNFKTLKDNIYDQFVLSRFLGFVKKVIGDE